MEKDIDSAVEDAVTKLENAGFKNNQFHVGEQLYHNNLHDVAWSPDQEYRTFKLRFFDHSKDLKIKASHLDVAKDVLKTGAIVATAAALSMLAAPAVEKLDTLYPENTMEISR